MDVAHGSFTEAQSVQNGTGNAAKKSGLQRRSTRVLRDLGARELEGQDSGDSENLKARLTNISIARLTMYSDHRDR